MNEGNHQQGPEEKHADREETAGGKEEESTRLLPSPTLPPQFRISDGGEIQRSAINHQTILTRMIFTTVFFCAYLNSLASCASVELGSQISPNASHFSSINRNHNLSNYNLRSNFNPLASNDRNVPLDDHSDERSRRLRSRQVSTSEWLFSSLVEDQQPSLSVGQQRQPSPSLIKRQNIGVASYRSMPVGSPSNSYTNYYRNPNIYAQTARRVNGNDNRNIKYNVIPSPNPAESSDSNAKGYIPSVREISGVGLDRRRASLSLSIANELSRKSTPASSKLPTVFNEPETGTTGVSRTAPATDPFLLVTERPTSTQEMQISNDESSTLVDDILLDSRAEIGRKRGRKKGREMIDGATTSFHLENNSPIVFPGTSPASTHSRGTMRPYIRPGKTSDIDMESFNPFQAKVLDGWARLHELRRKSQSFDGKKSSISSDQSADAKIISLLTIRGTPECASKDGFCEDIDTYPRNFFNQVLNRTLSPDIFKDIFGETTDNSSIVTDVEFKLRHDFDETPLCSVREHTIYPKAAQNRKGKFMYIVNHDEYLQGIRIEKCTRENDACMLPEGHLPGYTSTCKQKFIYKKLLAFTPDGKAMPDTFRLPSCCVCHVRSLFISDRINPGPDLGNADIQPTIAADDTSWNPSSTTLTYSHHDDAAFLPPSSSTPASSSVDPDAGSITFPTTSKNDLPSYQVPSPTTSTSSSQLSGSQQVGGQQQSSVRAENQTASKILH